MNSDEDTMKRGREEEEEQDSDAAEAEASDDCSAYEHEDNDGDVDDTDGASGVPLVQQLLEDIQKQLQVPFSVVQVTGFVCFFFGFFFYWLVVKKKQNTGDFDLVGWISHWEFLASCTRFFHPHWGYLAKAWPC
jgi:hypothetical protein